MQQLDELHRSDYFLRNTRANCVNTISTHQRTCQPVQRMKLPTQCSNI